MPDASAPRRRLVCNFYGRNVECMIDPFGRALVYRVDDKGGKHLIATFEPAVHGWQIAPHYENAEDATTLVAESMSDGEGDL